MGDTSLWMSLKENIYIIQNLSAGIWIMFLIIRQSIPDISVINFFGLY